MTNFADFKAAIEGISGGKNTVLLDKVPAMGGDGEVEQTTKVPVKFDISRCTLTLWSID